MKTTITLEMCSLCYKTAKVIFPNESKIKESASQISKDTTMNVGSAEDYLKVFFKMMNGEKLQHDISERDTCYYFEHIQQDFGSEKLKNALNSLQLYLLDEKQKHPGLQKIINEFVFKFGVIL